MKRVAPFLIGVALLAFCSNSATARDKYPPGPAYRSCPGAPTIFNVQQSDTTLAPCHPATLDTVVGVGGIITGFDAKASAFGFYMQNRFANGPHAFTGVDIFTGATNYNAAVPSSPSGGNLGIGDSVLVTGTTQEFPASNGETEIEGPDTFQNTDDIIISKVSSGNPSPGFHVGTTHEFNWVPGISGPLGAEGWEGCLVKIRGPLHCARIAQGLGVAGNTFLIVANAATGDSVLIDGFTLTTFAAPAVGTAIDSVQGIFNQRNSTAGTGNVNSYRIQIRDATDIFLAAPPNAADAAPVDQDTIRVVFDRNVDAPTATNPAHYHLASEIDGSTVNTAVMESNPGRVVRLGITTVRDAGDNESLSISGVGSASCPTCLISPAQTIDFLNGVLTVAAIQAPDPDSLSKFTDRSRYAGPGTATGPRVSVLGVGNGILGTLHYIADASGGTRSGVAVFGPTQQLTKGHRFLISGRVQEFDGETEIVSTFHISDKGTVTPPAAILQTIAVLKDTTTDMTQTVLNGEDYEGVLVRVNNVKCTENRSAGQSFFIAGYAPMYSDTIDVQDVGSVYTFDPDSANYFTSITGILHFANGTYRICPRNNADIVRIKGAGTPIGPPAPLSLSVAGNPAPSSRIVFTLPRKDKVELGVFDVQGRQVAVLAKGVMEAGQYSRVWNGAINGGRPKAGVYFYRLNYAGEIRTVRSVLIQ